MAKSILSNIKDIAYSYSDFASCESLSDEDKEKETSKVAPDSDCFHFQGRKRKHRKHKLSPSPSKEYFMKKQHLSNSPESSIAGKDEPTSSNTAQDI